MTLFPVIYYLPCISTYITQNEAKSFTNSHLNFFICTILFASSKTFFVCPRSKFRKPLREIEVHKIEIRLDKSFGSMLLALTKLIGLRHLIQPDKLYVGTFNPKSEDMG